MYQVEHTILSWLQLGQDDYLHLEAGEDIDEIVGHLNRISVQVKDTKDNVSLTSLGPYIANTLALQKENPGWRLSMRFLTTAGVATEQGSPFGENVKGIEAWNKARNSMTPDGAEPFLSHLESFLRGLSKTTSYIESSWSAFQDFLETAGKDDSFALVKRIEWQVRQPGQANMEAILLERLTALGVAEQERKACLQRLFYRVFQLLTRDGDKVLTFSERAEALSSTVEAEEAAKIRELQNKLADYGLRIGDLASRVEDIERRVAPLEELLIPVEMIGRLVDGERSDSGVANSVRALAALFAELGDLTPLPIGSDWINTTSLQDAVGKGGQVTWLNLRGGVASGKSSLARQLVDPAQGQVVWVRLPPADQNHRLNALRAFLAQAIGASWTDALQTMRGGSVLVIDGARLHEQRVADAVAQIALACQTCNVRLITTSTRPIYSSVPSTMYDDLELQPWSSAEIRRYFVKLGGPFEGPFINPIVTMVEAVTKGLPPLVRFVAREFVAENGRFDRKSYEHLFGLNPSSKVADETTARLIEELSEKDRELLFRLAVPVLAYSDKFITEAARVERPVAEPLAARNRLLDGWIERRDGRFATSPLAQGFSDQLEPSTLKACHHLAAMDVLGRESNTPLENLNAISHFMQADENDVAVTFLARLIHELVLAGGEALERYGSLILELRVPEVSAGSEIFLRAQRLSLARELGRDEDGEVDRIVELTPLLTPVDSPAAMGAFLSALTERSRLPFATQISLLRIGLNPPVSALPDKIIPLALLSTAYGIRTPDDADQFIGACAVLESGQLSLAFLESKGELAREAFEGIWLSEANKPENERNWPLVRTTVERLLEGARRIKSAPFVALLVRILTIILGEYQEDVGGALQLVESVSGLDWLGAEDRWLLEVSAGIQLVNAGRVVEGVARLTAASETEPREMHPRQAYWARLTLMRYVASDFPAKALEDIARARKIALENSLGAHALFRCDAEEMLIVWARDGAAAAWPFADESARRLFDAERDDVIKSDLVQFGHALGYIEHEFTTGDVPLNLADGEKYAVPFVGMFGTDHEKRVQLYHPLKPAALALLLADYAGTVGDHSAERAWLTRLRPFLETPGAQGVAFMASSPIIRKLLQDGAYAEAMGVFARASRLQIAVIASKPVERSPELFERFDVEEWFARADTETRTSVGLTSFSFIVVTVCCLLARRLARSEDVGQSAAAFIEALRGAQLIPELRRAAEDLTELLTLLQTSKQSSVLFEFGETKGDSDSGVKAGARLLASVQPDCEPSRARDIQASVLGYFNRFMQKVDSPGFDQVFVGLLVEYWRATFERSRLLFHTPRFVLQWLDQASSTGPRKDRPAEILKAMGLALRPKE